MNHDADVTVEATPPETGRPADAIEAEQALPQLGARAVYVPGAV